ncbi:forkhead box protein L1 [Tetranychus urticae]|uniref:Fork-head domain-containing protein n=1 Tax=Tetranychus urticae TaxID=32264 RepID=T1JS91_TETUR|nr:forkhead box protein L1 [Tetranychus urticae]
MCEKENPVSIFEYQLQLQLYAQAARLRLTHPGLTYNFGYHHPVFTESSIPPHFGGRFRFINEEPKPQHSYIGLIAMAILSSPEQRMVLSDIYQYILDNYPYFRNRGHGWRNSIRHNLSLNPCFIKSSRSANGKGHFWIIHPANLEDFKKGDFRRRKAQRKAEKHNRYTIDEDDSSLETPIKTSNSPPPLPAPSSSSPSASAQASTGKPQVSTSQPSSTSTNSSTPTSTVTCSSTPTSTSTISSTPTPIPTPTSTSSSPSSSTTIKTSPIKYTIDYIISN